jgi:tetratricopeptide (TPR) repeat protein
VLGSYAARIGDHEAAERAVKRLLTMAAGVKPERDSLRLIGAKRVHQAIEAYALAIRAWGALTGGDSADGVAGLKAAADTVRLLDAGYNIETTANVDLELGRIALAKGRFAEAERYFSTLRGWGASMQIAPAEYYLGRAAEGLGHRAEAREHYTRFVRWWRDCDPELKPMWEDGRQRLAKVSGEPREP